jgi:hypothetical protein
MRVRGEMTGVSADSLWVHVNTGENIVVRLTPDTLANIEDIKPGNCIGSAPFAMRMARSRR